MGSLKMELVDGEIPQQIVSNSRDLDHLKALVGFANELMSESNPTELFKLLLRSVVSLTQAEKGFIILNEDSPRMVAAHNLQVPTDDSSYSDTIVEKVLRDAEPVVITNALADREFSSAQSVVNLKLSSVMCVPLLFRTNLLGAIYLGNDSITGNFTPDDLEILNIWTTQPLLLCTRCLP